MKIQHNRKYKISSEEKEIRIATKTRKKLTFLKKSIKLSKLE